MAMFYASVSVTVLPSIGYEGYGVAALESSAAARPVIASSIGGLPEVVVHNSTGLLIRPDDVGELRRAIALLATEREFRTQLGLQGRLHVENHFSHLVTGNKMRELYEEVSGVG
jgi:glycosyltransferase involved in cell wall biosynthesis